MNYSFYYATRPAISYINVMLLLLFIVVMSILMNIDYDDVSDDDETNLIFLNRHT